MRSEADGRLTRNGATYDIVFRRRLKQPIDKVWAAVTLPERIADWFATMTFDPDLRVGAKLTIAFGPGDQTFGEVVAVEAPRLFAYRWPHPGGENSTVRFDLAADGDGTLLTFSQTGLGGKVRSGMADIGAGWHKFVDQLTDLMAGTRTEHGHREHWQSYKATVDALWGSDDSDGAFRTTGATCEVVFRRHLRRPLEKVWAALTAPARIGDWLADVTIDGEMRVGARFGLTFVSGYHTPCEVVALAPMRLFAWTWGVPANPGGPVSVVRFELAPAPDGCILTLTNEGLSDPPEDLVSIAGGWHIHLEALPGAADGVRTAPDVEVEKVLQRFYRRAVAAMR
jgi:uncharacterized protein YndB with AHSA1/START domain